jgi:hypothetical protein
MNEPEFQLSAGERAAIRYTFCAASAFISAWYLSASIVRSLVFALFVLAACFLNFERQWALRVGFAVAVLALAVSLGLPRPAQWAAFAKSTTIAIASAAR